MGYSSRSAAIAWGVVASALVAAQDAPIAIQSSALHAVGLLAVDSTSFQNDLAIPVRFSAYGDGITPQVHWSRHAGAKSYLLIVEDPDARAATSRPMLHWIAWNIPADATSIPEGLKPEAPAGMLQGRNGHGETGYMGMRPPAGDAPHHYHFQVFALDRTLDVPAGADRDAVISAASGHAIAAGEIVGTYQQKIPSH